MSEPTTASPARREGGGPLSIFVSLTPWIAYWIMAGWVPFRTAIAVAFVVGVAVAATTLLRRKPMKILEIGTAAALAAMLIAGYATDDVFLQRWIQPLTNGALLLIAVTSLLIGRPFTLQYARESVAPEVAAHPVFFSVNRTITVAWALAFAAMTVGALIPPVVQGAHTGDDGGSVLSLVCYWGVTVVAILSTIRFTAWYVARRRAAAVAA